MPTRSLHATLAACVLALPTLAGCSYLGLGGDDGGTAAPAPAPRVEIVVEGLDEERERNARAYLGLAEEPCDAPEWRIRRRFAQADGEIARGLRAFGHYHARVEKSLERGESCWQATFRVSPGARVQVAAVDVQIEGAADADAAFEKLLAALPLQEGEPLNHGDYEATKRKITSLAAERGYRDARLTRQRLLVDPDAGTARAELTLDSGPRYRLGELDIETEALDEDLVRRLLEYQPGQPYTADRVHRMNQALTDSGYFASVDVRPEPDAAEDLAIPVNIRTRARKRRRYSAGAGFATDTGPRVRLGYENRRINRRGHRVEARALASPAESAFTARYRVPLERPQSEWLTFSARAAYEDTDTFDSTSVSLAASATHLRGKWLETKTLEYRRENFEIGATDDASAFLLPTLSYARTHTEGSALRPDYGWKLFVEARAAAEALISDANIVYARADGSWLRSLSWGGRIIVQGRVGALATNDFDVLPPSLRFFAGGDNSVRGYDFETLGPEDDSGQVIGGRYVGTVSLEYEHPIKGAWSAAAFVDAGNAFDNDFSQDVKVGVGVGIRWQSPIGPVRVDLAHPVNADDADDTTIRLHLRLGPDL